jgi:hypothetical protein
MRSSQLGGVVDVDDAVGGGGEDGRVGGADPRGEGLHVPHVVAVDVGAGLAGEQVERGDAVVLGGVDGPAVAAIGGAVLATRSEAGVVLGEQAGDVGPAGGGGLEGGDAGGQGGLGGGGGGGVLAAHEALGLGGPGEDLAVEAQPVAVEVGPQAGAGDRGADAGEEGCSLAGSLKNGRPVRV